MNYFIFGLTQHRYPKKKVKSGNRGLGLNWPLMTLRHTVTLLSGTAQQQWKVCFGFHSVIKQFFTENHSCYCPLSTKTPSRFLPGHTARLHTLPGLLHTGPWKQRCAPSKPGPRSLPFMVPLFFHPVGQKANDSDHRGLRSQMVRWHNHGLHYQTLPKPSNLEDLLEATKKEINFYCHHVSGLFVTATAPTLTNSSVGLSRTPRHRHTIPALGLQSSWPQCACH